MLLFVRILLPLAIAGAGVAYLIRGGPVDEAMGVTLIGVAVVVVLANLFIRLGFSSARDREREEARRQPVSGPRGGRSRGDRGDDPGDL